MPPKNKTPPARIMVRIPADWLPHLDQVALALRIPGRGPTRVDAVRALILDGFKARGIEVTSVVWPQKEEDRP